MTDIMVWTLNGATKLLESAEGDIKRALDAGGRDVLFGNRTPYNRQHGNEPLRTRRSRLMHEIEDDGLYDEYWLPIPVKCIGDPASFRAHVADHQLWSEIEGHYAAQLADWRGYWREHRDPVSNQVIDRYVQMASQEGVGLYEILRRTSESHLASTQRPLKHVLIGMSEGGLVARYLAFLDEHVCNLGLIGGVLTIDAPHGGSVFAGKRNADNISRLIGATALAMIGFDDDYFAGMFLRARDVEIFDITKLRDVFRAGMVDIENRSTVALRRNANYAALVETGYRWTCGLAGDARYAFPDFDAATLDERYSVLGSLEAFPTNRLLHGAVIGCNDSVEALLRDAVDGRPEDVAGFLKKGALGGLFLASAHVYDLVNGSGPSVSASLRAAAVRVEEQIRHGIVEVLDGVDASAHQLRAVARRIEVGLDTDEWDLRDAAITSRRHDFIIPAACQAWRPPEGAMRRAELFLGNRVNTAAHHLSAASPAHAAGRKNRDTIVEMLHEMGQRLGDTLS